jgi:hypothetical protein
MKHPSIRRLFDYWNERRGARLLPRREDIEPEAIRCVLADTFILSFAPTVGHPIRVAGTRVCALFGNPAPRSQPINAPRSGRQLPSVRPPDASCATSTTESPSSSRACGTRTSWKTTLPAGKRSPDLAAPGHR